MCPTAPDHRIEFNVGNVTLDEAFRSTSSEKDARLGSDVRLKCLKTHVGEYLGHIGELEPPVICREAMEIEAARSGREHKNPSRSQHALEVMYHGPPIADVLEHLCGYDDIERLRAKSLDKAFRGADEINARPCGDVNANVRRWR